MNVAPASVRGRPARRRWCSNRPSSCRAGARHARRHAGGKELSLGIRPEGVLLSREQQPGYRPLEAHIIEPFGPYDIVDLKVGSRTLRARTATGFVGRAGEQVWARIDPAQVHFFDSGSGASLGIRLGA